MIFSLNINKVHYVAHTMCKHCFPLDNTLYLSTALKENRKHKNKILVCFCEMTTCSGQKRRAFSYLCGITTCISETDFLLMFTKLKLFLNKRFHNKCIILVLTFSCVFNPD